MNSRLNGYFVTGTDTGVGKTRVSAALLTRLCRDHARVAGFKPVASGCEATPEGLRNADALALQRAANLNLPYSTVNPYAFAPPIAPHLAAAQAGVRIDLDRLVAQVRGVAADVCVVEGVGGWRVPLTAAETVADLAVRLQLPVILVVGMRLGCLNHALLNLDAIRDSGVPLAGWVANCIDPDMAELEANLEALQQRLDVPLLARFPWTDTEQLEALADLFALNVV